MLKIKSIALFAALLCGLVWLPATETPAQEKVRVRFARGASAATVKGRLAGYRYIDYVVTGRAGQTMSVRVESAGNFAQAVVFDRQMETLDDAAGVDEWSGELPESGTYTVRVLLPRAEARRRTGAVDFALTIAVR